MTSNISTLLPIQMYEQFRDDYHVVVHPIDHSNPALIDLTNSPQAAALYENYLNQDITEVQDPAVAPYFPFGADVVFLPTSVQLEVYRVINSFTALRAEHLMENNPPQILFTRTFQHKALGFRMHVKAALSYVINEIRTSQRFAVECPGLAALPVGTIICNLQITYKNALLVFRITKL